MVCTNCGAALSAHGPFCPQCGAVNQMPVSGAAVRPRRRMGHIALSLVRTAAGALAILAVGWIVSISVQTLTRAERIADVSAIQIMQVYVEGSFVLIAIIGVLIAIYVATRWD